MSGTPFEEVTIDWDGVKYVVPASKVMGAIARIEQHVTLREILQQTGAGNIRFTAIASAYASVIRYAAALSKDPEVRDKVVTDEEVYAGMFRTVGDGDDSALAVSAAVQGLLGMMIPKSAPGKQTPGE